MYKTKLQEMCQRRRWGLPRYDHVKDGPDHEPRFKASVSVNGLSFHSSPFFRSSKDAQNDAAKLAFFHFSSPSIPVGSSSANTEASASGGPDNQLNISVEVNGASLHAGRLKNGSGTTQTSADTQSRPLAVIDDILCQYKGQLQNYTKWKNLESPSYSIRTEGPAHNLNFKAIVKVDGQTFESPDLFKTLKEAEHATAKAALMSLLFDSDVFQLVDLGFNKNLLQEMTLRGTLSIPIFKTNKFSLPQRRVFVSSV